jgi:5-methylcytosine-specific restriction protein A
MFYNDPLTISAEVWTKLLADREVTTEPDLDILKIVYESKNHEIRASEIASKLNIIHHGPINLQISRFSKRIIHKTGVQPPLRKDGTPRWWHVPFLGYEKAGRFPWIMRPELIIAFEEVFGRNDSELVYSGEITIEDTPALSEGAVNQVFVNRYERNRRARSISIAHYGSRCVICGFDFEKVYGPIGKDKIHIHHLIPLSGIQQEYEVDPIRDLCPVCPNCHLIIHSKREPFTIEEVRKMISMSFNSQ